MTKAERIFNNTRIETELHIERWGYDTATDGGWAGGWITETKENPDGECIYTRTQNALLGLLEKYKNRIDYLYEKGIMKSETYELKSKAYDMMSKTAKNTYVFGKEG